MKKQNIKHNKKQVTILSTLSAEASHPKVSVTKHVEPSVQISYRAPFKNKQPQPQNEGSMLPSLIDETQADNDKIELDRRKRKQNRIVKPINKSKQTSNSQNPKLKKELPKTAFVHKVTTSNAEEKSSKNLFRILDVQASSANYFNKIHNIKERPQSTDSRTHLEPDNTVPPRQYLEHVKEMQQHKNIPSKQYNVSRYTNNINNTHLKHNEARVMKPTHTPRSATQEKFSPRCKDSNGKFNKFYDVNKYMERHVLERDDFKGEPAQELTDIKMYSSSGASLNVEQRIKIVNEIQSEIMRWRKEFKAPRFFENICLRHEGNASIEENGDKLHPHPGQGLVLRLEENKHIETPQQSRTTDSYKRYYSSPMASLVLTDSSQLTADSFKKLPDQTTYPYAEPDDLQKNVSSSCHF
uniref:Uncharacterized protein n=1 Tax=Timema monikensis TaxID=170555 RepID=A0A7R9HI94_9NEOP|nr:unnamed protein product [Timema monikensis]